MKAFIIHTPHEKSIKYAGKALESFEPYTGWEPELFDGVTLETLSKYEDMFQIKTKEKSRAAGFYIHDRDMYTIKKCCSFNHYRLFNRCVELNEPIAVIEHDSHCIGDWEDIKFEDILVMNVQSALTQNSLRNILRQNRNKVPTGLHNINIKGLGYRHDPKINGSHIMPGTASYAVTPEGASKMIDVYENIGWEQSDFIINTAYVRIQTIMPELFTFKLPNLATSHGKNL